MNVKEKILLVQLLLEDIRDNWGLAFYGKDALHRALKAKSLCEEIASELNDDNYIKLANSCDGYIENYYKWGDCDGRYFRDTFPEGYINMDSLHNLSHTYIDKSDEFKDIATTYLTYPEHRFDDWEEVYLRKRYV